MNDSFGPMSLTDIIDEYFLENRHRLLDLAAFLDRLDRAHGGRDPHDDFRIRAFTRAISVLSDLGPDRARRIQMIFSDPSEEPRPALDRKAAYGAYFDPREVRS
jgi:hypothetical protein